MELFDKMLAGDVLSLSRLISIVESDNAEVPAIMKLVKKDKALIKYMPQVEAAEIAPVSAADEVFKSGKLLDSWTKQLSENRSRGQGQ